MSKNFKVFGAEEQAKKDVYFRLVVREMKNNEISLIACDKNGIRLSQGNILEISNKGIHLCSSVSKELGLPVVDNKIKLY